MNEPDHFTVQPDDCSGVVCLFFCEYCFLSDFQRTIHKILLHNFFSVF